MSADNEHQEPTEIVPASPEDAAQIAGIQKETWLVTYVNAELGITKKDIESMGLGSPEVVTRWRESIEKSGDSRQIWVAKESGRVVGYCGARRQDGVGKIQSIYVLPSCQGKGVGRKLMHTALAWLGREQDVVLDVASYNAPSIAFYERLGFVKTGKTSETPPLLSPGGKPIPEVEMMLKATG